MAGLALVVLSVAMVWTYRKEIRSWYAFRRDFEALGKTEQGYREYRHRETGIVPAPACPGSVRDSSAEFDDVQRSSRTSGYVKGVGRS